MVKSPSSKQREALVYITDKVTNFVGYGGAAFGGKSYLLCNFLAHACLAYPGTGWGLARKELVNLKKTTLLTLFKVFQEMNICEGRDYNYNGQLNMIQFSNGSEIFLIDTAFKPSDPLYTRFGGYELTQCVIDESAESPILAVNILFTRCGRRENKKYNLIAKVIETFNPVKNHVYYRYYKPNSTGTLKDTYKFIKALPADNPSEETQAYVQGILNNADQTTIERLIHGNFDYEDDPTNMINYNKSLDIFTNEHVIGGPKYITADIAFHGSDLFVVYVWEGWRVIDCSAMTKSDASQVEAKLKEMALKHGVAQSNIAYDADGIGSFLKGYLQNAVSFNNGAAPIEQQDKKVNYKNLKTQCYYFLADKINQAEIYVDKKVGDTGINNKFVKDYIIEECGVIKKLVGNDSKLQIITKQTMKELIGRSPDFMDALMIRAIFDLKPNYTMATFNF